MNKEAGGFLGAIADAGVVDTLVATLQHESPFCVSAAAGALWNITLTPGGGKALIEASGAVAALVHVIIRGPPAADLEMEMSVFCMYAPEWTFNVLCVHGLFGRVSLVSVSLYLVR